jgi:5'-3' exonuclease
MLQMLLQGVSHIGIATDHIIESFRNDLYPFYKTSAGVPPELLSQFPLLEEALRSLGIVVWPEVEFEADDALASAAEKASLDKRVETIFVCSPDKDLAQCVRGDRIVQMDRIRKVVRDEQATIAKFGVPPRAIPDFLALVGDSADGYPGLPGWGAKTAATVLSTFKTLDAIPKDPRLWPSTIRSAAKLCETLAAQWKDAQLFRTLATLRLDVPVFSTVDDLEWRGPRPEFELMCNRLRLPDAFARAAELARERA